MDSELKALLGSWIQAIGTLLPALGNTPSLKISKSVQTYLSLIGNTMQATGNALIVESASDISLSTVGNKIQAIGNSIVVLSIFVHSKGTQKNLNIKGDLLQSLGSIVSIPDYLQIESKSLNDILNLYANILQATGNALQALAVKLGPNEQGQLINLIGSWLQTIGAFMQAIYQNNS